MKHPIIILLLLISPMAMKAWNRLPLDTVAGHYSIWLVNFDEWDVSGYYFCRDSTWCFWKKEPCGPKKVAIWQDLPKQWEAYGMWRQSGDTILLFVKEQNSNIPERKLLIDSSIDDTLYYYIIDYSRELNDFVLYPDSKFKLIRDTTQDAIILTIDSWEESFEVDSVWDVTETIELPYYQLSDSTLHRYVLDFITKEQQNVDIKRESVYELDIRQKDSLWYISIQSMPLHSSTGIDFGVLHIQGAIVYLSGDANNNLMQKTGSTSIVPICIGKTMYKNGCIEQGCCEEWLNTSPYHQTLWKIGVQLPVFVQE